MRTAYVLLLFWNSFVKFSPPKGEPPFKYLWCNISAISYYIIFRWRAVNRHKDSYVLVIALLNDLRLYLFRYSIYVFVNINTAHDAALSVKCTTTWELILLITVQSFGKIRNRKQQQSLERKLLVRYRCRFSFYFSCQYLIFPFFFSLYYNIPKISKD